MEGETSKVGHRGKRIPMGNSSYENIVPPFPLSSYFGGDMEAFRPSELELMMMASRSNHSSFLKDLRERQALMDRQHAVLSYMEKVAKEAQALREENINLKMMNSQLDNQLVGLQNANFHLTNQLTAVHKATSYYAAAAAGHSGLGLGLGTGHDLDSMLNAMGSMELGGQSEEWSQHDFDCENDLEDAGLAGSVNVDHAEGKENVPPNLDRVSLPKSISVRSPGYMKTPHRDESGPKANKQKVLVPGGQKEDEALELDVYDQGMLKTELCNKWQDTGACPYGDSCQFAHGMKELRPIIRHPRYKTEVCRMILNGVHCPYGHRCHFRHTLSDEEKLMRSRSTARPLKPRNC